MRIFVKTPTGTPVTLEVDLSQTIGDLKAEIENKICIPSCQQRLVFDGKSLNDCLTLEHYRTQAESILYLVPRPRGAVKIFVKVLAATEKTITVEILPSQTIGDLKAEIKRKIDMPPYQQRLVCTGKSLDNYCTLEHYHIQEESALYLVPRLKDGMKIFVKLLGATDETITVEVEPSQTIGDLKAEIEDKMNLPHYYQRLVFAGQSLEDCRTIEHYDIQEESTLYVAVRLWGGVHYTEDLRRKLVTVKDEATLNEITNALYLGGRKVLALIWDVDALSERIDVNDQSRATVLAIQNTLCSFVKKSGGLDESESGSVFSFETFDAAMSCVHMMERSYGWLCFSLDGHSFKGNDNFGVRVAMSRPAVAFYVMSRYHPEYVDLHDLTNCFMNAS